MLEWLITNKSTGDEEDVIEDVTAKTLNTLIGNVDNLVVLFCKYHFLINYYNNYHQNLITTISIIYFILKCLYEYILLLLYINAEVCEDGWVSNIYFHSHVKTTERISS